MEKKTILTREEILLLINVVSQISVPVNKSQRYIQLINKMSKMADEAVK